MSRTAAFWRPVRPEVERSAARSRDRLARSRRGDRSEVAHRSSSVIHARTCWATRSGSRSTSSSSCWPRRACVRRRAVGCAVGSPSRRRRRRSSSASGLGASISRSHDGSSASASRLAPAQVAGDEEQEQRAAPSPSRTYLSDTPSAVGHRARPSAAAAAAWRRRPGVTDELVAALGLMPAALATASSGSCAAPSAAGTRLCRRSTATLQLVDRAGGDLRLGDLLVDAERRRRPSCACSSSCRARRPRSRRRTGCSRRCRPRRRRRGAAALQRLGLLWSSASGTPFLA